jgi:hypothetical protein
MSLRTQRSNLAPRRSTARDCFVAALLALTPVAGIARAAEPQHCTAAAVVLWGDGRHDDTRALNAWLRGKPAIWGGSGAPIGAQISGRAFRLSAPVYVPGGSGRTLANFRLVWPERGETVSGGAIRAGGDPDQAPTLAGVSIVGGDPGEAKPFDAPDPPAAPENWASCATS